MGKLLPVYYYISFPVADLETINIYRRKNDLEELSFYHLTLRVSQIVLFKNTHGLTVVIKKGLDKENVDPKENRYDKVNKLAACLAGQVRRESVMGHMALIICK